MTDKRDRITHLTKLRAFLRASSAKLDEEAKEGLVGAAALEQARFAAECRNLDREIAELVTWIPIRKNLPRRT
jgi:hypothetical protein